VEIFQSNIEYDCEIIDGKGRAGFFLNQQLRDLKKLKGYQTAVELLEPSSIL